MAKPDKNKSYLGGGGQLTVMGELLARGWNVSIPVIDVGDDILVIDDGDKSLVRVQVKTASLVDNPNKGKKAYFTLPRRQMETEYPNELIYALVVRENLDWHSSFILDRDTLRGIREDYENSMGKTRKDYRGEYLGLSIYFNDNNTIIGWKKDFSMYKDDYKAHFEIINHNFEEDDWKS